MSDRERRITEYKSQAMRFNKLSKQYQDRGHTRLAEENKKKAIQYLKDAKILESMEESMTGRSAQIQRNLARAEQDPEFRDELLRGVSQAVRNSQTRRREREEERARERERRRNSTVSRRSGTASQRGMPVVVVEGEDLPSELEEEIAEIPTSLGEPSSSFNPRRTLRDGSQLHDLAAMMRENMERSDQILRDTQRDLEERNAELRRLAEITGISVDEYLNECPVRPVAPPSGPPPPQPSKLKFQSLKK